MPYMTTDDLPSAVRDHLPIHAREIYLAAFNHAWNEYADYGEGREQTAHRVAWGAVKRSYCKLGDQWVRREKTLESN